MQNTHSGGWIERYMSRGHNGVVGRFFGMLFCFSLFVPIAALLRVADLQPTSCPVQLWHALGANWLFPALVVSFLALSVLLYVYQRYRITQCRLKDQEISDDPNA